MLVTVPAHLGYLALAGLVAAESAGVPVPGEAALTAAALLSAAGALSLPVVVGVAAAAAIAGDNVGFWVGRRAGRRALRAERGPFRTHRARLLVRGEAFFARHGTRAVVAGRFVAGIRVVTAVVAGASGMSPLRFLAANATGAVAWATLTAALVWWLGPMGAALALASGYALAGVGSVVAVLRDRARRRRALPGAAPAPLVSPEVVSGRS